MKIDKEFEPAVGGSYSTYYSDSGRHLICVPYSIPNLHAMAKDLNIKRCWFHPGRWPHYDIPKRRIAEIAAKTQVITQRALYLLIKENR